MSITEKIVQRWADAVGDAVGEVTTEQLDAAAELGSEYTDFYFVAERIVEPNTFSEPNDASDYAKWMEDDIENWVGWITTIVGTQWGKVARIIQEEGY